MPKGLNSALIVDGDFNNGKLQSFNHQETLINFHTAQIESDAPFEVEKGSMLDLLHIVSELSHSTTRKHLPIQIIHRKQKE